MLLITTMIKMVTLPRTQYIYMSKKYVMLSDKYCIHFGDYISELIKFKGQLIMMYKQVFERIP